MGGLLSTLFAWPNGIVVGNLIASALWAIPVAGRLFWHHRRAAAELAAVRSELAGLRQHLTGGSAAAAAARARPSAEVDGTR